MFYIVNRIFFKGDAETHSTQVFASYEDARKRYYNIIAADLNDESITYQMANIISSGGILRDIQVFDRRQEEE